MEAPFIVIKAWMLCHVAIFFYRRFFQTSAPPEPDFERWVESQPLLAAISGDPEELLALTATLAAELGSRGLAVATLGGWPWPNYALSLCVENQRDRIEIRALRCRLLKTREAAPPALVSAIRAAIERHALGVRETWLHAGLVFDFRRESQPAGGLRLLRGGERKPKVVPLDELPCWLTPARLQKVA